MFRSVNPLNERLLQQDLLSRLVVSELATVPEGNLPVYVLDTNVEYELSNKSQIELTPRIVVSVYEGRIQLALLILEPNAAVSEAVRGEAGTHVSAFFGGQRPLIAFSFDLENNLTLPMMFGRTTSTDAFKVMLCEQSVHGDSVPDAHSIAASFAQCLALPLPSAAEFGINNLYVKA